MIQANFLHFPEKLTIRFYVLYEERYIALNTPGPFSVNNLRTLTLTLIIDYSPASNLAYLASLDNFSRVPNCSLGLGLGPPECETKLS